jgi:hypothetical protein
VPASSQTLPPGKLSQDDSWNIETANMAISLGTNHWSYQFFFNKVVHPIAGKQMENMALMNDPDLKPLWKRGFSNEAGRLFQGSRDIPGTNTCLFLELTSLPKDIKITDGKLFVTTNLTKSRRNASDSRWAATD